MHIVFMALFKSNNTEYFIKECQQYYSVLLVCQASNGQSVAKILMQNTANLTTYANNLHFNKS